MPRTIDLYEHTNSLVIPEAWSDGLHFLEMSGYFFRSVHQLIRQ